MLVSAAMPRYAISSPSAGAATSSGATPNSQVSDVDVAKLQTEAEVNKFETGARAVNDLVVHLALSQGAAVTSMVGMMMPIPGWINAVFAPINTATGVASIVMDLREMRGTFKNPIATKMDRAVDLGHFVLGDIVSTAASMVPAVPGLISTPVGLGFFFGGQLMGLGLDIFKTAYDFKRRGQQSAYKQGQKALEAASQRDAQSIPQTGRLLRPSSAQ